jgi:hypothetical protein
MNNENIEAARAAIASRAANVQGAVLPGGPKDNEPGGPGILRCWEQAKASPATNRKSGSEVDTQPTRSEQKKIPAGAIRSRLSFVLMQQEAKKVRKKDAERGR